MNTSQTVEEKIRELPEELRNEVNDFMDFLITKQNPYIWQSWKTYIEGLDLGEVGMNDYLKNLEDYEDSLAKGEIKW